VHNFDFIFCRQLVIDFTYFVRQAASQTVVDAAVTSTFSLAELQTMFAAIQVSRMVDVFYTAFLYDGDISLLIKKTDLCMVAVKQRVATQVYSEFNGVITMAWKNTGSGEATGLQLAAY
jgi:hypothetical protein